MIHHRQPLTLTDSTRILKGVVNDDLGEPLVGATIFIEETALGTITDLNGKFSIAIPNNQHVKLRVSYVGYESFSTEITIQEEVRVVLTNVAASFEEVVVTALGISRDKKALGYSVQEIDGAILSEVKDPNFINNLQGKLAGAQVVNSTGALGGGFYHLY